MGELGSGEGLQTDPDFRRRYAGDGPTEEEMISLRYSNISPTSSCEGDREHEGALFFSPPGVGGATSGPRRRDNAKKRAARQSRPQAGVAPICKPPEQVARRRLSAVEVPNDDEAPVPDVVVPEGRHLGAGGAARSDAVPVAGSAEGAPSPGIPSTRWEGWEEDEGSPAGRPSDSHLDHEHDEKRRKSSLLLGSLVDVGTMQPHPARRYGDANLSTHSHKRRSAVWDEAIPSVEQLLMLSATSPSESEEGMFSEDEDWNDFEVFGARARSVAGGSDLGVSEAIGGATLWRHREVRILRSDDAQVLAQETFSHSLRTVGSSEHLDLTKDELTETSVQQELRKELERAKAELQAANHEMGNIKEESMMLKEERDLAKADAAEARSERDALAGKLQEMHEAEQELRKKLERTEKAATRMRESIFSTELQRDAAIMQFHLDGTAMSKRIEELEAGLLNREEEKKSGMVTRIFGRKSVAKEEKEHEIDPETGKWLDFGLGSSTVAKRVPKMHQVMEHVDICKNMELVDPEGVVKLQLERMRIQLEEMEADYDALLDERKALQSTISAFTDGSLFMPDVAGATAPIIGGDIRRMSGETPVGRKSSSEKLKMLTWASQGKLQQSQERDDDVISRAHSGRADAEGGRRRGNLQIDAGCLDEPISQTRSLMSPVKASPTLTPQEGPKPHRRPPALGEVPSLRDGTVSEGQADGGARRAAQAGGSKSEGQAGVPLTPSLAFAPITPMGGFRGQIGDKEGKEGARGGAAAPLKGGQIAVPLAQAQALRRRTSPSQEPHSPPHGEGEGAAEGEAPSPVVTPEPDRPRARRGSLIEAAGRHLSLAASGHSRGGAEHTDKALREQGVGITAAISITHEAPLSQAPEAAQRRSSISLVPSPAAAPAGPPAPGPPAPGAPSRSPLTDAPTAASQRKASASPEAPRQQAPSSTKEVLLMQAPLASQRRASISRSPERTPDAAHRPANTPAAGEEAEAETPKVSLEQLSPPARSTAPICRAEKHSPDTSAPSAGLATPSPQSQASPSQPKPPVPGRRRHAVEPIRVNPRRGQGSVNGPGE